ncbi:U3 small nucleolar RNA-associated protein 11 [Choiromyces venosus 120613-1]|uniref:U3 small nucleolar RNA-associated protein 11 n=1 Tax=Choiromyces venosus 120613-1 TaxID=1336337 RepID=A0A3N4IUE6_9PEZI|nr:U3 small nucleolar RNA-associated protein 11 [Choiromyces venosus 120613-1]
MSSMRNAVQRRNHKERSQPSSRQKYGLLEKKKDYVLRARDFNAKKAKLKTLRQKATERNPDEFYYAMINSRTRDGGIRVAARPDEGSLSNDVVKLLKTQDAGYVRLQSAVERKKIERLEERLVLKDKDKEGGGGGGKHVVFVDGEEEARGFRPEVYFGTTKEMVERRFNRMRKEQVAEIEDRKKVAEEKLRKRRKSDGDIEAEKARRKEEALARKKLRKAREGKERELEARKHREAELKQAEREMELQRARMGKGGMVKQNKWARVRKR